MTSPCEGVIHDSYEFLQVFCRTIYHLATPAIGELARHAAIYKDQKFSDHAPITIDYDLKLA